jgi:hypothetical protein
VAMRAARTAARDRQDRRDRPGARLPTVRRVRRRRPRRPGARRTGRQHHDPVLSGGSTGDRPPRWPSAQVWPPGGLGAS